MQRHSGLWTLTELWLYKLRRPPCRQEEILAWEGAALKWFQERSFPLRCQCLWMRKFLVRVLQWPHILHQTVVSVGGWKFPPHDSAFDWQEKESRVCSG